MELQVSINVSLAPTIQLQRDGSDDYEDARVNYYILPSAEQEAALPVCPVATIDAQPRKYLLSMPGLELLYAYCRVVFRCPPIQPIT